MRGGLLPAVFEDMLLYFITLPWEVNINEAQLSLSDIGVMGQHGERQGDDSSEERRRPDLSVELRVFGQRGNDSSMSGGGLTIRSNCVEEHCPGGLRKATTAQRSGGGQTYRSNCEMTDIKAAAVRGALHGNPT